MLSIFTKLFDDLRLRDVVYCNWKGHFFIDRHLNGDGDVDLFVPVRYRADFEKVAKKIGFVNVMSYQAHHEFIEHYFGYDSDSQKFAHLHVYFKIVTGESVSKNYLLPIDTFIENGIEDKSSLPTMNSSSRRAIFLVRHFLKIGSAYGIFQYWREKDKYDLEWRSFGEFTGYEDIEEIDMTARELDELDSIFRYSSAVMRVLRSVRFKRDMRDFRRRNFLKHQYYILCNLLVRAKNRVITKRKKLIYPGLAIAICGLDGTGKSSLVSSLTRHYSQHFSVKNLHLGRPSATKVSLIFKPVLFLRSEILKFMVGQVKGSKPTSSGSKITMLYAIRSVLLAYDRRAESDKAHMLSKKGYLVICDRYPGLTVGKMDSPRIKIDSSRGVIYKILYKIEQDLYKSIKPVDMLFRLQAPLEIAIERNNLRDKRGKETDEELEERFLINSGVSFSSLRDFDVDATDSLGTVFSTVSDKIWFEGICK